MRLTRFSDIGLRVLIYLERAGERTQPVTVAEIGRQFDIPLNHLVKVVGQLAKLGWVQATRGRNGGLRLAADPATLTIGQVLRKLEGEDDELVDCEGTDCALKLDCQLRGMLRTGM
jgi:Rrf2 family nitric oxide-sensitive transcriptional repressor